MFAGSYDLSQCFSENNFLHEKKEAFFINSFFVMNTSSRLLPHYVVVIMYDINLDHRLYN